MRRRAKPLGHISPDPALTNPDCLPVGEDHLKLRVCLTPNQKRTLFKGKVPKQIGCGNNACVYEVPGSKTKVMKLTADPTDVAGLMQLQATGIVPKVYRTFQLAKLHPSIKPSVYQDYAVFAVEVERLRAFTKDEVQDYNNAMIEARPLDEAAGIRQAAMKRVVREGYRADQRLRVAGFQWNDHHGGNVGLDRQGKLKILDVGYSGAQLTTQPTLLEGAARRFVKTKRAKRLR